MQMPSRLGASSMCAAGATHHRKLTFQEESLVLLKAHEIEHEERYLWK